MLHRIRASVVVPDGEHILLVKAYAPETWPSVGGMTGRYWNSPGGGLGERRIGVEGAERELREETGPGRHRRTRHLCPRGHPPPGPT